MTARLFALLAAVASPAAGFCVGARNPTGFSGAGARTPLHRSLPPQLVLGRVQRFVSNRVISPFKRDQIAEEIEAAVLTDEIEDAMPEPVVLSEKKLTAADKLLVKLGVKTEDECVVPEEGEDLMEQIKCAGRAGIISYVIWEWIFWIGAGGIAAVTYYQATGGWPDLSNPDDQAKVGASAFALVNVARFAVPLRIGLALSTTPWVDENIVSRFTSGEDDDDKDGGSGGGEEKAEQAAPA